MSVPSELYIQLVVAIGHILVVEFRALAHQTFRLPSRINVALRLALEAIQDVFPVIKECMYGITVRVVFNRVRPVVIQYRSARRF